MGCAMTLAQSLSNHEILAVKHWIVASILCLCAGVAQAQSTYLKRLETQNEARGWQAVGRLGIESRGFCSGTLIAPDLGF
jgi:adenine/guanine phosphoribosyltransferase-like PRPP-binding protein